MEHSPVYKRALGALWTAGYRPDRAAKSALRSACGYRVDIAEHLRNCGAESAMRALAACGYPVACNPDLRGFDLVQALPLEPRPAVPMAGDIIRPLSPWNGWHDVKRYALQGVIGAARRGFTVANAAGSWHAGVDPEAGRHCISLGSGGPASIGYLDGARLQWTGERERLRVWSWVESPCANGGADWQWSAPVWEWTPAGDGSDFIDWDIAESAPVQVTSNAQQLATGV